MGVFYLDFLPPDCLDTHGLFASWANRSDATTTKRLYRWIPPVYIHPKQANVTLARTGKQKLLKLMIRHQMLED